ncbi:MAG: IS4 family transposase [Saprospiraceae bacterium]|nr:IS4 family transposase [Saprospiraceae bacterium]
MEHISELLAILNGYFGWNKARMSCFAKMLIALMVTRSINLNKIACFFTSEAQILSRYRRLQRFFAEFTIDYDRVAGFIFRLFFVDNGQWFLTMDRTNWKWGKLDINILTLGIAFKGTAIPIYWTLLDKRGNSDTKERIELIQTFIDRFGKECIKGILADREFIGKDWFNWLLKNKLSFVIRIKNNTLTTNSKGLAIDIDALFYGLKPGEQRQIKWKRKIWGHELYLTGLRLSDGELLMVASDKLYDDAIKIYGLRWQIETLFACLKGRGFNFEDTHITELERIKKVFVLLSIAFCWAHKTGEWQNEVKPIKLKKHGRPAVSLFRYGLDCIVNAIAKMFYHPEIFRECLTKLGVRSNEALTDYSL